MERIILLLKTYDEVEDRSALYCGGGAVLVGAMAWRELSMTGEMGLRFWLMLVTGVLLVVGAMVLMRRYRVEIEVTDDLNGGGELKISRKGRPEQLIESSQLGYVKLEKGRVIIHYYESDDLKHTSFPVKGARNNRVVEMVEVLEKWQA